MNPGDRRLPIELGRAGPRTFRDPGAAIRAAEEFDTLSNSLPGDRLRGRTVQGVFWTDTALTLVLGDRAFLNLRPRTDGAPCPVDCALDEAPLVPPSPDHREEVVYVIEGEEWSTSRIAVGDAMTGRTLTRVQFSDMGIFLAIPGRGTLSCGRVFRAGSGDPLLHWDWTT